VPYFIGLMSGTSLDGVDGVLAELDSQSLRPTRVLGHAHLPLGDALSDELLALNQTGPDELHRAAVAAQALMGVYAQVVARLLVDSGCDARDVVALGAHGQTVRHQPLADIGTGYTLQLVNGAWLAEQTGIATVCDFRSADVAAGGQGAPLVPAFHAACFAEPGRDLAVLNIGGIGNLTLLSADGSVRGFDTGPGNVLMDLWCQRRFGHPFDDGGQIAASGTPIDRLLSSLLCEPYFALPPPKSTGRDLFHGPWLDQQLAQTRSAAADPADVMATLAELTARSVTRDLQQHLPQAQRVMVCGGGAANRQLMQRLKALMPAVDWPTTDFAGVPPDQVEALAFAWLAACRLALRPASLPSVTGASGARVLGAVYPAPGNASAVPPMNRPMNRPTKAASAE
jgi:anhydro-N-acetylmuramic acid kinase